MRRLLATACGDAAVTNGYTDDLLSTLTHTNTSGKATTYSFVYGAADLQTAVNIGSRSLVSNAYNSGTWTLSSQTYGNGDYWKYFYDNMDTLTSRFTNCSDNEGIGFYYTYNGKGKLVRIEMKSVTIADGAVTGGTLLSSENYLYDGSDRLIRVVETDGDNVVLHDFSWTYDAKDNVTALTESIGGKSFSYTYAYDDDSRPTSFGYGDVTKQVTYDGHGRSSGTTVKNGSRTVLGTGYAYRDVDSTYTTTQVKAVTNSYGGKTANFNYTYDANGNILSVSGDQTVTYEYDDLGQLVWEKNATAGKAWNYTYDNGGNILSRTEYACSGNGTVSGSGTTTSYTYGDAEWGDLLTAYNGEAISYDGIGNPLSYRGWTMNWQGGRQLASMTKGSDTLSFAYNESGLRTSKTVNGVTHNYVWQGSKLAADITDSYALYFHYDSSGDVIGFTRTANGADTEYFYVKNLQGDILKVITATGTEAATYTYDAWGKLLTSTGDMADVNPLRYRGYYYDTETGLYYLKSRYYDPEVGRFINPDAYASTGQGILGTNMFTYCRNNPVNLSDPTGTSAAAIISLALLAIATALSGCGSQPRENGFIPFGRDSSVHCYDYMLNYIGYPISGELHDPGYITSHRHGAEIGDYPDSFTTAFVASYFSNDLSTLERSYTTTTNFDEIPADRTDVVVIAVFQYTNPKAGCDYHFAVLLSDGKWADKPGPQKARCGELTYDGTCWNDGSDITNDGADTIFFIVRRST